MCFVFSFRSPRNFDLIVGRLLTTQSSVEPKFKEPKIPFYVFLKGPPRYVTVCLIYERVLSCVRRFGSLIAQDINFRFYNHAKMQQLKRSVAENKLD